MDPVSTWTGDRLWTGKPFRHVISQLGLLNLPSLRGRQNEDQLQLWHHLAFADKHVGVQVKLCVLFVQRFRSKLAIRVYNE